ncbi:MAG: APC family permease [Chthoniobacterales bacterium]|nr:APC family permease [Chthoniobacterales bacterium]
MQIKKGGGEEISQRKASDEKNARGGKVSHKGLGQGTIGTLGAVVVGLSCCAPAYTMTAALGPAASWVNDQLPAIFIVGFIPMFLVAMGYMALNRAMPDTGTTFTWATRAFGPWVGWIAGWGLLAATILVIANTAGIAEAFLFMALSQIFQNDAFIILGQNPWVNSLVVIGFLAISTWISHRGMHSTKGFQFVMVAIQVLVLGWFIVGAFIAANNGSNPESIPMRLRWFNPFAVDSFATFSAGIAVSIFVYWGWDTVMTLSEESGGDDAKGASTGKASAILILTLVGLYTLIGTATVSYAGIGDGPTGLNNPAMSDNVFGALSHPIMGWAGVFLSLAVLCSAAASLQSTGISPARTLLAMGYYKAIPSKFAEVHPKYKSPTFAILVSGVIAAVFYVGLRLISKDALWDSITALGLLVCFYYGITAFACVWYFRRVAFRSLGIFFMRILMPGLGGSILFVIFFHTTISSLDPDFGSGADVFGVGLVFIMGAGVLALGVVVMGVMAFFYRPFFRGEVLPRDSAPVRLLEVADPPSLR